MSCHTADRRRCGDEGRRLWHARRPTILSACGCQIEKSRGRKEPEKFKLCGPEASFLKFESSLDPLCCLSPSVMPRIRKSESAARNARPGSAYDVRAGGC